jgi:hypothetical protein
MVHSCAEYLAAGANRHPSAADWDISGLLAFGADRNVALWWPQVRFAVIQGHESRDFRETEITFRGPRIQRFLLNIGLD